MIYLFLMLVFIGYHLVYAKKIIPGVQVRGLVLGGKTTEEAKSILEKSLTFPKEVEIKIGDAASTQIASSDIEFQFLVDETVTEAFNIGRKTNWINSIRIKATGLVSLLNVDPVYSYNADLLQSKVLGIKKDLFKQVSEPAFIYINDVLNIVPGSQGSSFDEEKLKNDIISHLVHNDTSFIKVDVKVVETILTLQDLDILKPKMQPIISKDYIFEYEGNSWPITKEELLKIVIPEKVNDQMVLKVDNNYLSSRLNEIAKEIDRNPSGQVLEVENGKAVQFVPSTDGLKLQINETLEKAIADIFNDETKFNLIVQVTKAPESDNKYNIEQILGEGKSKFKGSAESRMYNIELASSRVNGILVAPGDEFSFNESIGKIDKTTGYTTAWIINKGRTVLGDGGGVCQVSTTVFRAALAAGLPITERNAHSYRVSYYEQDSPPGIDATIYSPSVDLRFKNDTPGYILVTSEFNKEETSLIYRIYGKNDGRTVKMTEPVVTSRTAPPAPIYEDDSTLPKGKTVQVEYAIYGASVSFERTVERDGKVLSQDKFRSNYRACGAVYKIGTK